MSEEFCTREFIRTALAKGQGLTPNDEVRGRVYTGVDSSFTSWEDPSSLFTFEARPDGLNVVRAVETGYWTASRAIYCIREQFDRYPTSVLVVENNAARRLVGDWLRHTRVSAAALQARLFNVHDRRNPDYTVCSFVAELARGEWAFPSVEQCWGMKHLIAACLEYSPHCHVSTPLMAAYFAKAGASISR